MKREEQLIEQEIEAVMTQGREIRPTPDVVRARLLARARSAFAASKASPDSIPAPSSPTAWRGPRVALAASVAVMCATAAVAAAFHVRVALGPEIAPPPLRVSDPLAVSHSGQGPQSRRPPQSVSTARIQRPHRVIPQESYAAELRLLQRAQSEYASHEFIDALVLLAEHRHRFPNGRLAEEREALCVESLVRAGRDDEARRALATFANRFPHSAFLPRLQSAVRPTEE